MRDLSHIVRVAFRVVIHGRHDVSVGGAVAPQLIRHQLPRIAPLPLQKLAKEPLRGTGVAASLNQDFDHVSVLVNGSPQVAPLALVWTDVRTT